MNYSTAIKIPLSQQIKARIAIPGSKSLTNRTILIAALADGVSTIYGALTSDDTSYMLSACQKLGISIEEKSNTLIIKGNAGRFDSYSNQIYIGNAGTAARFLSVALTLGTGSYLLNGNERMQQRPMNDLLSALQQIGCNIIDINQTGCPPIKIQANGFPGGNITIFGDQSSQYISALMIAAPYAQQEVNIIIEKSLVSRTYVEMTFQLMQDFGIHLEWKNNHHLFIPNQQTYQAQTYYIEPDASSASYFFAAAAITGGEITIDGLSQNTTQGDLQLLEVLSRMGCKIIWGKNAVTLKGPATKAIEIDMNTMSDVVPTLAVIALFVEGTTKIYNVANMRIKECDRIDAIANELKKLGARVDTWEDGLAIHGHTFQHGAEINTYDDHRIAMAMALAGMKIPNVIIKNPKCVEKTFPDFFEHLFNILNTK